MKPTMFVLSAALLAGCASYQPAADDAPFTRARDTLARIDAVAAPQCPKFSMAALGSYMKRDGDKVRVTHVVPGGAAQEAGLTEGDLIVAYDGMPAQQSGGSLKAGVPVNVTFERGGRMMNATVVPEPVCKFQLWYNSTDGIDGRAEGVYNKDGSARPTGVLMTRGMVDFASQDAQLYFVEAHEVCHLLSWQDGVLRMGPAAELAADKCAIGLMVQGHVDPTGIPAFMQHLEDNAGTLPKLFDTVHPPTAERIAALKVDVAVVEAVQK